MLVLHGIYEDGKVEITDKNPPIIQGEAEIIITERSIPQNSGIKSFLKLNQKMSGLNIHIPEGIDIDSLADEAFHGLS